MAQVTMNRVATSPPGPVARTPPRLLEVLRTTAISPRMRRITLGGEAIAGFPARCGGAHIKVFFPRGDQAAPELPTLGPDGPVWPPTPRRPITRTYSVRRYDAQAGELDVDFVLHGDDGPASRWAHRARPGDRIGIAGPGGPDPMLGPADWYLLAGDLSALPAIGALLEALPKTARGHAVVAVPDAADVQEIDHPPHVALTWIYLQGEHAPGPRLEAAVRALGWPDGRVFAWVAGESSSVVAIRDHLLDERGLGREALYAIPYWKASQSEEAYHAERHRIMDGLDRA
ncbi:siderophore-interacting protein [Sorangium sp. wiwo2]|uniref:Siderophore-interacting protein n=2 Tax=Sorangium atrum TaxID=2995308 RepID=A0ABT5C6S7_9BACT|nr:siderophore-interacting protein [Sorangium aterium]MDC0682119.1 siderophore-interacting protein [Sorangium aterium]